MRKADEIALFDGIKRCSGTMTARQVAREIGMNEKRACAILEKWYGRGWWECGVHVLGGWFTPQAPDRLSVFERAERGGTVVG